MKNKFKKIAALIMAFAMTMSMGAVAFAAGSDAVPSSSDTAQVYVYDVEEGVTVTAYQLLYATYASTGNGLTGYEIADAISDYDLTMESPTADEITAIAHDIYDGKITGLTSVQLTWDDDNEYYTASLTAGMWLILVYDSGAVVYNPMIVSNWYSDANLASSLQPGYVDASGNFIEAEWTEEDDPADRTYTVNATAIYAKSDNTSIDKEITNYDDCEDGTSDSTAGADFNTGDTVDFELTTYIPDYSDAYGDDTTFTITDVLSDGFDTVSASDITVTVAGSKVSPSTYQTYTVSVTTNKDGSQTIVIDFLPEYIIEHGAQSVVVTYSATLIDDAAVVGGDSADANVNAVKITYSSTPKTTYTTPETNVYVYTFSITDEIVKVTPDSSISASGNTVTATEPLEGAEFTIYTDEELTTVYTNANNSTGVSTSDENGYIAFTGLQEGTYYITETESPTDYMINDTIYKIVIAATYDTAEGSATEGMLTSYTITVTNLDTNESNVTTYTVTYTLEEQEYTISSTNSNSSNTYTWYEVTETSVSASENPTAIVDADLIKLPSTGGIGIFVIVIISVCVFGTCAIIVTRKKKTAEE